MLNIVIYGIVALGTLFFILNIKWESISVGILTVVLWTTASVGVLNIEIPYVYTSAGVVYEATQVIEAWEIGYLFVAFAFISFLMLLMIIFDTLKGKEIKVM